jgi:hypothetical protein
MKIKKDLKLIEIFAIITAFATQAFAQSSMPSTVEQEYGGLDTLGGALLESLYH